MKKSLVRAIVASGTILGIVACGGGQVPSTSSDFETPQTRAVGLLIPPAAPQREASTARALSQGNLLNAADSNSTLSPANDILTAQSPAPDSPVQSKSATSDRSKEKSSDHTDRGNVCGADLGGWTQFTPTPLDSKIALRSLTQPGSRLIYLSSTSGSDQTGAVYFWNGAAIVDENGRTADSSGLTYGTDPTNPSSAVKPFKRWSYVAPRRSGSDIGSRGEFGNTSPTTRAGYPDWWLFKRGDTFDLTADILSFARETDPTVASVNSSLSIPGGRSVSERQVIGAYGSTCAPRPRFINPQMGFVTRHDRLGSPSLKNVAYLSLHFDANDRSVGRDFRGITLYGLPPESTNILFEDLWIDGAQSNFQKLSASITIRRSVITDAFEPNGSHVQGIWYSGNRDSVLRIEESILMRNGFKNNPKVGVWPPSGDQIWSIYSRNLYLSGETRNLESQFVDSVSLMGASGDQFRPGMRVERNFFYQGYVLMAAAGGYDPTPGSTGVVKSNVVQRFKASGTNDNRGQPGWGIYLMGGANEVDVVDNIITGAQHSGDQFALELNGVDWDCETRNAWQPTSNNRIRSNIMDSGEAKGAIRIKDGAAGKCAALYHYPGVVGNAVSDNILINKFLSANSFMATGGTTWNSSDTQYANNRTFATRAEAASAMGWKDPNRTLKTYLISKGIPVASSDGYIEYYNLAIKMRRGQWNPDLTGRAIINHVRDGFMLPPLQ